MYIATKLVNNWYRLGLELGLLKSVLTDIQKSHPFNPKRCMLEALNSWWHTDPDHSWHKLMNALNIMEEKGTVENICRKKKMGKKKVYFL